MSTENSTSDPFSERMRVVLDQFFQGNQAAMAKAAGVAASAVGPWITGKSKPSTDALIKLCEEKELNSEWLLFGKGEAESAATEVRSAQWQALHDRLERMVARQEREIERLEAERDRLWRIAFPGQVREADTVNQGRGKPVK